MRPIRYLRDKFRTFFRSVGLALVAQTRGKETPKVLLTRSRWVALSRCSVHILPSAVSLTVIVLNLCGLYVGEELAGPSGQDDMKLGVLQVCAKVQELLIVGSLTMILIHVLRDNLLRRSGVPLGLVGAGFAFTQVSFFWSPDFLGSLRYRDASPLRKWLFLGLLVLSGGLALVVGPAAAVLMSPRNIDWPVGGTRYWLNGTAETMWPMELSSNSLGDYDNCTRPEVWQTDWKCPATGFASIYGHISGLHSRTSGSIENESFEIHDSRQRRRLYLFMPMPHTISTIAHAPSAGMLLASVKLWMDGITSILGRFETFPTKIKWTNKAEAPYVQTGCSYDYWQEWCRAPKPTDIGPNATQVVIEIPSFTKDKNDCWVYRRIIFNGDNLRRLRERIALFPDPIPQQTLVVPFNGDDGNSVRLVLLVHDPDSKVDQPGTWKAVGCKVSAYWAEATAVVNRVSGGNGYNIENDQDATRVTLDFPDRERWGEEGFKIPYDDSWRQIKLTPGWLDLASPMLGSNTAGGGVDGVVPHSTTLESLMSLIARKTFMNFADRTALMQSTISIALADAVSRTPAHLTTRYADMLQPFMGQGMFETHNRNDTDPFVRVGDPPKVNHFKKPMEGAAEQTVAATISGYVMTAAGWFDYFSIAVLLCHALLALAHTVWVVFWRSTTSDTWESVAELVVLAQSSPPPAGQALANTSAGIWKWGTQKTMVWVEESRDVGEEDLMLRIEEFEGEVRDEGRKAVVGKAYGRKSMRVDVVDQDGNEPVNRARADAVSSAESPGIVMTPPATGAAYEAVPQRQSDERPDYDRSESAMELLPVGNRSTGLNSP